VTVYQETYDRTVYAAVHPGGGKRDFNWRLDAPDRLCSAGMRKVNIGSLLGLHDWRAEAVALALHGSHLMKRYWQTQLSLSFPRITDHPEDFSFTPVPDRDLVQMVTAFRIFFPDANLVISTREGPELRMNLVRLGVTQMSAGSRTTAGGYDSPVPGKDGQFHVHDSRPPSEVAEELRRMGYEPVWKDWESGLS
jgi:2-iminoacetate synthase